mmetsp:Transcript_30321/g.61760  ORF Transcript_30321/g.61760 Transcript_30321/m.61760 type:complete len:301 (-) Transcript_30321:47-949(-)
MSTSACFASSRKSAPDMPPYAFSVTAAPENPLPTMTPPAAAVTSPLYVLSARVAYHVPRYWYAQSTFGFTTSASRMAAAMDVLTHSNESWMDAASAKPSLSLLKYAAANCTYSPQLAMVASASQLKIAALFAHGPLHCPGHVSEKTAPSPRALRASVSASLVTRPSEYILFTHAEAMRYSPSRSAPLVAFRAPVSPSTSRKGVRSVEVMPTVETGTEMAVMEAWLMPYFVAMGPRSGADPVYSTWAESPVSCRNRTNLKLSWYAMEKRVAYASLAFTGHESPRTTQGAPAASNAAMSRTI